jgi:hypothetical protein
MSAVFKAPENGDHSIATETLTSDKPQFDLKSLYSDFGTANGSSNSSNENALYQLDFDDNVYSQTSRASGGQLSFEQRGAMDIASRFASFDNDTENNTAMSNFDREDAGRLVEVFGDMLQVQNSINEGDKKDASQWLGELRRDLASFARGIFDEPATHDGCNSESHENTEHGSEEHGSEEHGSEEHGSEEHGSEEHGSEEHGSEEHGSEEHGSEEHGSEEHGSESGYEDSGSEYHEGGENSENSIEYTGPGMDGYTPEDTMVLLSNDMQELTDALSSGDMKGAQRIMARMNRHMAMLMQHLNRQNGNNRDGQRDDDPLLSFNPDDPRNTLISRPSDDFLRGLIPNDRRDMFPNPGDLLNGLPTPGDLVGIRNPLERLPQLPNPGDVIGSLPQLPNPGDVIGGLPQLPNPGDVIGGLPQLPNPGDVIGGLPQLPNPGDVIGGLPQLPNPGDVIGGLPQLPNPSDVIGSLPQLPNPSDVIGHLPPVPNPGNIFDNIPSPRDLFDLF